MLKPKPPLGVMPHKIRLPERMKDIADAIRDYLVFVTTECGDPEYFEKISEWADELRGLAALEAELRRKEEK